eukprot:09200.XXX_438849_437117_1 [CDS] Oithona nana genome sequencing.
MSTHIPKPVRSQSLRERTRGNRKMSDVTIETYTDFETVTNSSSAANVTNSSSKETSPSVENSSVSSSRRSTKDSTPMDGTGITANTISFVSGNPFVEVTKGILHLYKENSTTSLEEGVLRSQMICMLGVPAKHKTPDLLQFTAPCHSELEMMRVINYKDVPNQYMVLLRFRCQAAADEFYQAFNGLPYNSFEPEVCSLVYISKVETCKESEFYPLSNHTELPVCSICLERMDESISSVLTILCNHTFHGQCLAQWEDASCPVCRYVQTPELVAEQRCSECQSSEDLWICLVCGYVGCGRYVGGHSHAHFLETEHSYTMELGQNRVWDYVGDNFVHRLMQTDSADGKLVEAEGTGYANCKGGVDGVPVCHDEKMDSIQLEYTYLLTSQLESQRRYFEEKMTRVETSAQREIDEMVNQTRLQAEDAKEMKDKVENLTKEKAKSEQRLSTALSRIVKLQEDLKEEKQMNENLLHNQKAWQKKFNDMQQNMNDLRKEKDCEITDLKEQIRDVMFYLEAQNKVVTSPLKDEIQQGDVVLPAADTGATPKVNGTQRGKGRKKR